MSEPIPESIPTSSDPRSKRPTKRLALTPTSRQANQVDALFANPDREINIVTSEPRSALPPPPEIVPNVQGSSAGAGSGEFHVYKSSRRREYERLKAMDDEVKEEEERADFEREREERRKKDESKTSKNKAKRDKAKERKKKGKDQKQGTAKELDGKNGVKKIQLKALPLERDATEDGQQDAKEPDPKPEEAGVIIHDDND
ncbi:MAG: hypothetical protein MMC23_004494 [Stictis urceolatum]|nr:hypothetical protein [Stictis urceolata]